tara:strand:- start:336 stop:587 length:252 start_codon:yes stop_codon:yes gene_type:complete
MGRKIRYVINESNHPLLVKGKIYSLYSLAREAKMPPMTLRNRVGLSDVVTDEHFVNKKRTQALWPEFETETEAKSAKWLKRAL